jgi:hypothetical protein
LEVELNLALGNGESSDSYPCCFNWIRSLGISPRQGLAGLQNWSGCCQEKKILLPLPGIEPRYLGHPDHGLIAIWFCSCHCCRWYYYYYYSLGHRQNNPEIGAQFPPGSSPNHPDRPQGPFPCRRGVGGIENYTSTFPYAFLVSCSIMHMDNITHCYKDSNY